MFGSTRLLIALAILASLAASVSATTWDLTADYSSGANPNGAWSYGYKSAITGTFTALTVIGASSYDPDIAYRTNQAPSNASQSYFLYWNSSSSPYAKVMNDPTTALFWPPNQTNLTFGAKQVITHVPYPGFTGNYNARIVCRWTSPVSGGVHVVATFNDPRTNNASNSGLNSRADIVQSGSVLFPTAYFGPSPLLSSSTYDNTITVAVGDTLDFQGGDGGWVGIYATITEAATPGTFSGYVRDSITNAGVGGVLVQVVGGSQSATTAADGSYSFQAPAGTYSLKATAANYDDLTIANQVLANGGSTTVNFPVIKWGTVSGYVTSTDPGNPGVAGVTVSAGTSSTTTGTDGHYSMYLAAGAYSVTASKAGYESTTNTGVSVSNGANTGSNFTLNTSFIKGKVTVAVIGTPVVGASVSTTSGGYSTTTDTAGNYSLRLTSGTYTVQVYKSNWQTQQATVTVGVNTTVTQSFALIQGWDLANDYAIATDPNGPWWYGFDPGSGFAIFTHRWEIDPQQLFMTESWATSGEMLKNAKSYAYAGQNYGYMGMYAEAGQVVVNPPTDPVATTNPIIARFVAPTGGYFRVQAKFTAQCAYSPYTQATVSLVRNGSEMLLPPSALSGFIGQAANGFADSTGTSLAFAYDASMAISPGDVIDAKAVGAGWVGLNLTVSTSPDTAYASGTITSSLAGHYPLIGALITFVGGPGSYQTYTGSDGTYSVTMPAGTYRFKVERSGYNSVNEPGTVIGSGLTTLSRQLTHNGTWNYANDFTNTRNPNGEWSYGWLDNATPSVFTSYTDTAVDIWTDGTAALRYSNACWVWQYTGAAPGPVSNGNYWLEPGMAGISDGFARSSARWTAPYAMVAKITLKASGQYLDVPTTFSWGPPAVSVWRNSSNMFTGQVCGFAGRSTNNYTDSIGPSPIATFQTALPINSGDVIEVRADNLWNFLPKLVALDWQIEPFVGGVQVNTFSDIKAQAVGTTVFMMTPVQLACGTNGNNYYFKDGNFYIMSDDKSMGMKVSGGATAMSLTPDYKITFTGTIVLDPVSGQKMVHLISINSATLGATAQPMGRGSKALTASNSLVKVWGKVTHLEPNTGTDSANWAYEYITIDDGGGPVKILTHVQGAWFSTGYAPLSTLAVGNYIAVTGIAETTTGTDVVVCPRKSEQDMVIYTP